MEWSARSWPERVTRHARPEPVPLGVSSEIQVLWSSVGWRVATAVEEHRGGEKAQVDAGSGMGKRWTSTICSSQRRLTDTQPTPKLGPSSEHDDALRYGLTQWTGAGGEDLHVEANVTVFLSHFVYPIDVLAV
jgi:hypothetical protein